MHGLNCNDRDHAEASHDFAHSSIKRASISQAASHRPPRDAAWGCETTARELLAEGLQHGAYGVFPRRLGAEVEQALDKAAATRLPMLRMLGSPSAAAAEIKAACQASAFGPDWLTEWLANDIAALGRLFQVVAGAERLSVRLEAVNDDACRRFHTDYVRYRLISTYRGPGTQWISPDLAQEWPEGKAWPASGIRQFERGAIAIMRGRQWAAPAPPALLHRSPPLNGRRITRLFLAIDDAADHRHEEQEGAFTQG